MKGKIESRLQFLPNPYNGSSLYEGKPCPTLEAYNLLGNQGVKYLDKKVKQLVESRTEMFGKRLHNTQGFPPWVRFFDISKRKIINLIAIDNGSHQKPEKEELLDSNLYIPQNYLIEFNNQYMIGDSDKDLKDALIILTDCSDELLQIDFINSFEIPEEWAINNR